MNDTSISNYEGCPSADLLTAYVSGAVPSDEQESLSLHLMFCNQCIAQLANISTVIAEDHAETNSNKTEMDFSVAVPSSLENAIQQFQLRRQKQQERVVKEWEQIEREGGLRIGQIWRTKLDGIVVPGPDGPSFYSITEMASKPHLVVITNTGETVSSELKGRVINVAPIDGNVEFTDRDDVVVPEMVSPLGYSFIIQLWNSQPMLAENLDACLGELTRSSNAEVLERLKDSAQNLKHACYSVERVVSRGLYKQPLMRYRAREYEATSYLRMPAEQRLALHQLRTMVIITVGSVAAKILQKQMRVKYAAGDDTETLLTDNTGNYAVSIYRKFDKLYARVHDSEKILNDFNVTDVGKLRIKIPAISDWEYALKGREAELGGEMELLKITRSKTISELLNRIDTINISVLQQD